MANPQKENGYIAIANEIVDALCKSMPGYTEGQIIFSVIRKTYGWNKKEDQISISQIQSMTKKSRRMVIYALQNLEAKKFIHIQRNGLNQVNTISFNKNWEEWVVQEKRGVVQEIDTKYTQLVDKQKVKYKERGSARIGRSARIGKKVVQELVKDVPFLAPTTTNITKDNTTDILLSCKPCRTVNNTIYKEPTIYLNEKASRSFNPGNKSTLAMIRGRFAEGRTMEDFKKVIDKKVSQWKNDPKMCEYLRPKTLFNATNFENYLNERNEFDDIPDYLRPKPPARNYQSGY